MFVRGKQGQSLILLALGLVGLLAMAGLGIDGGRLFSARRSAQNAADAAAKAAALVIAQQKDGVSASDIQHAKEVAIQRAADNGFTLADDDITITQKDGTYYVDVTVKGDITGTFISVVRKGPIPVQASARVKVTPQRELVPGYALAATNEHVCNALSIHLGHGGTLNVEGGIFSNTDATVASGKGGGSHGACVALFAKGHSGGTITADYIHTVADGERSYLVGGHGGGGISITPTPEGGYPHMILPQLPTPVCSQEGHYEDGHYWPGRYPSGIQINSDAVFEPGIYCLDGDFRISGSGHGGGSSHGGHGGPVTVTGEGVFFYLHSGSVKIHHAEVNLKAPLKGSPEAIDAAGNRWGGMLFYLPPENPGNLKIAGKGTIVLRGTIYAPGPVASRSHGGHHARCMIGGHEGVTPDDDSYPSDDDPQIDNSILQIICDTVRIHGHSKVTLRYDSTYFFGVPVLDVTQ